MQCLANFQETNDNIEIVSNYFMTKFEEGIPISNIDAKNGIINSDIDTQNSL